VGRGQEPGGKEGGGTEARRGGGGIMQQARYPCGGGWCGHGAVSMRWNVDEMSEMIPQMAAGDDRSAAHKKNTLEDKMSRTKDH